MIIRDYQDSDKEKLLKILNDFQDYLTGIDPLKRICRLPGFDEDYLKWMLDNIDKKQGKILVAEDEENIVGFIEGSIKTQTESDLLGYVPIKTGEVDELYVDSEYRKKGLGSKLVESIENYFKENNCKSVVISVFAPNSNALGFYRNKGYQDRSIMLLKDI